MKPDWKKILLGLMIFLFTFSLISIMSFKFHLLSMMRTLSEKQHYLLLIFINIIYMLTFSFIGFLIAKKKGREPRKWMLVSFFFHVFAIIYLYALPDLRRKTKNGSL